MKLIQRIRKMLDHRRTERNRKDVLYYDHYTMLGTILGETCSLLKFGGK